MASHSGTAGSSASQERSLLIDIVRGLAISLVVIGHVGQGLTFRDWWGGALPVILHCEFFIYSFHMPAFFFVSGIFLCSSVEKRGVKHFIRSRAGSILYPYLLWTLTMQEATRLFLGHMTERPEPWGPFLVDLLTGKANWFLVTLFFALMVGMALRKVPMAAVFVAACVAQIFWKATGVEFIDHGLEMLPFLVAGMWVARRYEQLERVPIAACVLGIPAIGWGLWVITGSPIYDSRWLTVPLGLGGTLMLLLLARCLSRSAGAFALTWVGVASLGVYLLSPYMQGASREAILHLLRTTNPWVHLILTTFISIAAPAYIYQRRHRLRLGWLFIWPFQGDGAAAGANR